MSDWITDRLPTKEDGDALGLVWLSLDFIAPVTERWEQIHPGEPWMPVDRPAPYVKPKRFVVWEEHGAYAVRLCDEKVTPRYAYGIPTREAAKRIAQIFEEVMP
jgi:hypothetical protein